MTETTTFVIRKMDYGIRTCKDCGNKADLIIEIDYVCLDCFKKRLNIK